MEWSQESLAKFNAVLGSNEPTPGGGAATAAVSSISAALLLMVVELTENRESLSCSKEDLSDYLTKSYQLIDKDCEGFQEVMRAYRLPNHSQAEKEERPKKIEQALKKASIPPEKLMDLSLKIIETAQEVLEKGNKNAWTETAIAAQLAFSGLKASYYNVIINICEIDDKDFNHQKATDAQNKLKKGQQLFATFESYLNREVIDCEYLE